MVVDAYSDLLVLLLHDVEPNGIVLLTGGRDVAVTFLMRTCCRKFHDLQMLRELQHKMLIDSISPGDGCGCTNLDKMSTDHKTDANKFLRTAV